LAIANIKKMIFILGQIGHSYIKKIIIKH